MFDVRFSRRDFLRVGGRRPAVGAAGRRRGWQAATGEAKPKDRGRSRSSSSTSAAACRTTTASTSSPTPRTRSAASTSRSPPASPACRSARCCRSMAKVMDKVALVRSGSHNNDHHETATNWVLSGRFGSAFGDYPAIGAVVAHETGFTRHAAALRRGAAEPVVHLGTGQERVPRRPLRVVQGRRPERSRTTRCRTSPRPRR